jgi:hypothetical protein
MGSEQGFVVGACRPLQTRTGNDSRIWLLISDDRSRMTGGKADGGVTSTAFDTQPPDLRAVSLMENGLCKPWRLCSRPLSGPASRRV